MLADFSKSMMMAATTNNLGDRANLERSGSNDLKGCLFICLGLRKNDYVGLMVYLARFYLWAQKVNVVTGYRISNRNVNSFYTFVYLGINTVINMA